MSKFKKKLNIKRIIGAILVVAAVVALGCGVSGILKKDDRTLSSSKFSLGSLDENGKYVEDKQAIYTKDAFECVGLRIEPDFEAKLTYDVYYYDANEKLLEAKIGLTEVYDEDFPLAKLARVVIHPEIPSDVNAKDFKISRYKVNSYAKQLKITVNKDQDNLYGDSVNLYVSENAELDKSFNVEDAILTVTDGVNSKVSENITVSGEYEYYDIYVKKTSDADTVAAAVATSEDNTILARASASLADANDGEWRKITVKVPELESSAYLVVRIPATSECYVYGYNK